MRFLYAISAMVLWATLLLLLGSNIDSETFLITLAIVAAGAMAGGDG